MDYKEAASYRDYISAVKTLNETQRSNYDRRKDMDVIIPVGKGENTSIAVFPVRDGKLSGRRLSPCALRGRRLRHRWDSS